MGIWSESSMPLRSSADSLIGMRIFPSALVSAHGRYG
jgi:hypothetical protein